MALEETAAHFDAAADFVRESKILLAADVVQRHEQAVRLIRRAIGPAVDPASMAGEIDHAATVIKDNLEKVIGQFERLEWALEQYARRLRGG
jgi:hypothetical protein